ncbi:hypothetical protein LMG27177_00522 [Paraburkholderia fynbosensis]|uniref:Uncharacterized protein n=1 Tax=Paraburkholderia fynbosensis TaxID=1200993 RepID=A0A6J5FGV0_9BURK|nr:hypothetical protein LMG27177_00522 [Paraburkholderia fynbosensis]
MTAATTKDGGVAASKAALKTAGKADGNVAADAGGWPVDDITGLARRLPEVDPARYFDGQAKEAFQQSLLRWPLLARLMNLMPAGQADTLAGHDSAQKAEVE